MKMKLAMYQMMMWTERPLRGVENLYFVRTMHLKSELLRAV
jgi:hypothetical protein